MLTETESPALATANRTPSKTIQLLRKRLRQLARVALALAGGLALAAAALSIWWLTSLNGLPDIGDPFDVAAFRGTRIAGDQNAFTFLRRAEATLTPWPKLPTAVLRSAPTVPWSKVDPKLQAWVEENREALALFLKGAEQSDAGLDLTADPLTYREMSVNPGEVGVLALMEGSRRQEGGDMGGAWACYRAVLRATAHSARRGRLQQTRTSAACRWLGQRLATWAADSRTTIPQLRAALDEALEAQPTPDWDSHALKLRYLETMRALDRPMNAYERQQVEGERTVRLGGMQVPADAIELGESVRRFLLREPERSRRVLRLLYAHWLAHVETRDLRPQKPAVRALLRAPSPASVALYSLGPLAPAGARALPPRELASWLKSAPDAKRHILGANSNGDPWPPNRLYRRAHRGLVIMLATELYRRERGALPASEQALVGTYLERLPDDGSADLADERTPTVE